MIFAVFDPSPLTVCINQFFWATVCKTVRPLLCYRSVVCAVLSCLSVTFVHCGQTVGRIKTKLGMQVGLVPGHIVLDGDPAPPHTKGWSPFPIFGPFLLWPNGWMHQDATWYGGRPQPKGLCIRWGPSPPPKKGEDRGRSLPIFSPCLLWPNGWMDQDGTWHGGRPWSSPHCARLEHSSPKTGQTQLPLPERGTVPNFRPTSVPAKWLHGS